MTVTDWGLGLGREQRSELVAAVRATAGRNHQPQQHLSIELGTRAETREQSRQQEIKAEQKGKSSNEFQMRNQLDTPHGGSVKARPIRMPPQSFAP